MNSSKTTKEINRRGFLALTGAGAIGALTGCVETAQRSVDNDAGSRKRTLRFAHMTDMHVFPERHAAEGLAAALGYAQGMADPPELLVTGGDNINDAFYTPPEQVDAQYQLLKEVMKNHCRLPVKWCIGNHDTWGYDKAGSKTTGNEPLWGKRRPVHEFGMPDRYYSFDAGGWRFIILDSTFNAPEREGRFKYIGKVDDEQFAWLEDTLQNTSKPIVVVSHIPIFSITTLEWTRADDWHVQIPGGSIHYDCKEVIKLLEQFPNVKLCLSGHQHLQDRIEYNGITLICDGAVSAAWWGGDHFRCDEGFGVIDLYDDGSFEHQYVAYGWKPKG